MIDPGTYGLIIMRQLAKEPRSLDDLCASIGNVSTPQVLAICKRLVSQRYVKHTFSKYRLTALGLSAMPKSAPAVQMRPYIPERIVRRPGSDRCSTLPSRVAGRLVYPR